MARFWPGLFLLAALAACGDRAPPPLWPEPPPPTLAEPIGSVDSVDEETAAQDDVSSVTDAPSEVQPKSDTPPQPDPEAGAVRIDG